MQPNALISLILVKGHHNCVYWVTKIAPFDYVFFSTFYLEKRFELV